MAKKNVKKFIYVINMKKILLYFFLPGGWLCGCRVCNSVQSAPGSGPAGRNGPWCGGRCSLGDRRGWLLAGLPLHHLAGLLLHHLAGLLLLQLLPWLRLFNNTLALHGQVAAPLDELPNVPLLSEVLTVPPDGKLNLGGRPDPCGSEA